MRPTLTYSSPINQRDYRQYSLSVIAQAVRRAILRTQRIGLRYRMADTHLIAAFPSLGKKCEMIPAQNSELEFLEFLQHLMKGCDQDIPEETS